MSMHLNFKDFSASDYAQLKTWFADSRLQDVQYDPDDCWFEHTQDSDVIAQTILDDGGHMLAVIQLDKEPNADGYFNILINPEYHSEPIAAAAIEQFVQSYTGDLRELISFASIDQTNWQSALRSNGFATDGYVDDQGLIKFSRVMSC